MIQCKTVTDIPPPLSMQDRLMFVVLILMWQCREVKAAFSRFEMLVES